MEGDSAARSVVPAEGSQDPTGACPRRQHAMHDAAALAGGGGKVQRWAARGRACSSPQVGPEHSVEKLPTVSEMAVRWLDSKYVR